MSECAVCWDSHGAILPELCDYDWREAFKYAVTPAPLIGDLVVTRNGFAREDVVEILYRADGQNEEEEWVGVFRLRDGRFAVLRAGCDYSGWG